MTDKIFVLRGKTDSLLFNIETLKSVRLSNENLRQLIESTNAFLLAKVKSLTCRRVNVHIKQFIVKKVLQAGAAERRIFSEEYLHNTIGVVYAHMNT